MKEKLIKLGVEKLAESLIDIGKTHSEVRQLIDRLIATPNENLKRFKTKLSSLKKSDRFIDWKETDDFAFKLKDLLDDLEMGNPSPSQGLELITAFIKTDNVILNRCDDSSGMIGQVYSYDARKLFIEYAKSCEKKDWVESIVFDLMLEDDFGVRDSVLDQAKNYLPEPNIRSLITKFQTQSEAEENQYKKRSYLHLVESLALQVNDPQLFEKTRTSDEKPLSSHDCIDIAEAYLKNEDAQTALSWANRASQERYSGKKELLLKIHEKLKNYDEQANISKSLFKENRSTKTLNQLLSIIGEDKKAAILEEELKEIFKEANFSLSNAAFLLDQQLFEDGEKYIIQHGSHLDGDFYDSLLPLAKNFEKKMHWLPASLIYRALLNSILDRAYAKAYPYGVRYLRKLDEHASLITKWKSFDDHTQYKESLRKNHGRKFSFWGRYEEQEDDHPKEF